MVGFDPEYRKTLRNEYLTDFEDYSGDIMRKNQARASGQGLRGGIPMSIQAETNKDLSRARQAALADIDIRDLEARREDINRATYAQPEVVQLGSNIQNQRANFDLSEYGATQPVLIEDQPGQGADYLSILANLEGSQDWSSMLGHGGSGGMPTLSQSYNKSMKSAGNYYQPLNYSNIRASGRVA